MRYAVISKGLPLEQLETEVKKVGATDVKKTKLLNQVFCELDEAQAEKLAQVPGLKIKPLKEYKTDQVMTETPVVETVSDVFYLLRSYFTPPLTGTGLTVAVLDSGARKSRSSPVATSMSPSGLEKSDATLATTLQLAMPMEADSPSSFRILSFMAAAICRMEPCIDSNPVTSR